MEHALKVFNPGILRTVHGITKLGSELLVFELCRNGFGRLAELRSQQRIHMGTGVLKVGQVLNLPRSLM